MKTVLVPGAPWPSPDAPVKPDAKEKRKQTDYNYEAWVKKQKDALVTGALLGANNVRKEEKCKKKSSTRSTKTTSKRTSQT